MHKAENREQICTQQVHPIFSADIFFDIDDI